MLIVGLVIGFLIGSLFGAMVTDFLTLELEKEWDSFRENGGEYYHD